MIGCLHPILRSFQWFYHYYMQDLETVNNTPSSWVMAMFILTNGFCSMFWFTLTLTKDSFRNSLTNCTRLDLLSDMENPPLCCGAYEDPMNEYDMGACRNWINDFGWNPVLWFLPITTNDSHYTYPAHRFPAWPLMPFLQFTQLQGQSLERIRPNSVRVQSAAIAAEYRLQRVQEEAKSTA